MTTTKAYAWLVIEGYKPSENVIEEYINDPTTVPPEQIQTRITIPVLAINGEKDLQVPPKENLSEIEKALHAGGNRDVKTVELRGLNHLFQPCKTGTPSEYARIA